MKGKGGDIHRQDIIFFFNFFSWSLSFLCVQCVGWFFFLLFFFCFLLPWLNEFFFWLVFSALSFTPFFSLNALFCFFFFFLHISHSALFVETGGASFFSQFFFPQNFLHERTFLFQYFLKHLFLYFVTLVCVCRGGGDEED